MIDCEINTIANDIEEGLLVIVEEVLGRKRKKIQIWIMNAMLDPCDERRELKGVIHPDDEAWSSTNMCTMRSGRIFDQPKIIG